jgi:competence protein ComEA
MFKRFLVVLAALFAVAAFAATDVNKATQAELEAVKGVGPAIAGKILDERKKGAFKDWTDFVDRVKGVGEGNAAKFSAEGMTVGGAAFKGVAAAPAAAKKDDKPAAKPAAAVPAAAPMAAKAEAKPAEKPMAAAAAKPADKPAAAAAPMAAKAEAKPAMKEETKVAAKDTKPAAAKEDKKAAKKADAAASAPKK